MFFKLDWNIRIKEDPTVKNASGASASRSLQPSRRYLSSLTPYTPEPQCIPVRIPKPADCRGSSLPILIHVNRLLPFSFAVHSRSLRCMSNFLSGDPVLGRGVPS